MPSSFEQSYAKVSKKIDENLESHISKIQEFLRQPSISAENYGVRECAELLRDYFKELGCQDARLVETKGHPVVYAEVDSGAPKTLAIYMMYDTQPIACENWSSPPLEARTVNLKPFGRTIIARGAINTKGPLRAFLSTLEVMLDVDGRLPVNLKFTAEGEEELGSPHLPDFMREFGYDHLKGSSGLFIPSASQDSKGKIRVTLGRKGIVYFELECSGANWGKGPTEFDIHSSNKAWVDSPVWRLVHALSTMTTPDGNRILIDGFYNNVAPPSSDDLALVDGLEKRFDEEPQKSVMRVKHFIDGVHGREALMKYLFSTTLNVDGIWGGYAGPGTKTVLPHKVACKMDVRLVPNQRSPEILPKIRRHLDKHGFSDIQIKQLNGYEWSKTSAQAPIVQATLRTYRSLKYEDVEIWPHAAGSAPMYLYSDPPLRLDAVGGGLGHGGRAHAPDEYFVIDGNGIVGGLQDCEKSYARLLYEFAST